MELATVRWEGDAARGHAVLLEQTLLPAEERYLAVRDLAGMIDAIRRLAVRGAPAIGVAAAYGFVLGMREAEAAGAPGDALERARAVGKRLCDARPTAVNLPAAVARGLARLEGALAEGDRRSPAEVLLAEARRLEAYERDAAERMGAHGAALLADGTGVLTHCNAGALATVGLGTALAPMYAAARAGKRLRIFADETRPLLQGARLTAWELSRAGLDVTVIADGAAGHVLSRGWIGAVIVGADRIAWNGDVANKIGTYPLSVLARRHGVPFYVVAPLSTVDRDCPDGAAIPIEERSADEVTALAGRRTAPEGVAAFNPAFDVTPAELVSAWITEAGVARGPDPAELRALAGP